MSDFIGKSNPGICITKLHASVKGFQPRGGASVQEVEGSLLIFGGADREQSHFNDCLVYRSKKSNSIFEAAVAHGDIPMERSGHQTAAYGKYQFLFGGINFAEESVFNDLYILNTETFEWNYVGESGKEIPSRNSHSIAVINAGTTNYLVVFGGASPESGPMGDTFFAELPDEVDIDTKSIYVTWKELESPGQQERPIAREMHSTSSYRDRMIISGGRSCDGAILSDVWELCPRDGPSSTPNIIDGKLEMEVAKEQSGEQDQSVKEGSSSGPACSSDALIFTVTTPSPDLDSSSIQISAVSGGYAPSAAVVDAGTAKEEEAAPGSAAAAPSAPLVWRRRREMELPSPRCAHGSAIICRKGSSSDVEGQLYLVLFGGFTGAGVAGDITVAPIPAVSTQPAASPLWQSPHGNSSGLQPRFGHAMAAISSSTVKNLLANKRYAPIFSAVAKGAAEVWLNDLDEKDSSAPAAAIVFGGVSELTDFGDIWLLQLT